MAGASLLPLGVAFQRQQCLITDGKSSYGRHIGLECGLNCRRGGVEGRWWKEGLELSKHHSLLHYHLYPVGLHVE